MPRLSLLPPVQLKALQNSKCHKTFGNLLAGMISKRVAEQFPKRVERLRNHARAGKRGHEIGVAGPARDEMPMKMSGQAGAGDAPQIQTDVETVGLEELAMNLREAGQLLLAGNMLVGGNIGEVADVAARRDQQVPVVVRIAIENDDRQRSAVDDEQLAVGRRRCGVIGRIAAEEALAIGACLPGGWLGE